MATTYNPGGTLRTDYETDRARLDNYPALESDWRELLHRLISGGDDIRYREEDGREGALGRLFENQVLTVLMDIVQEEVPTSADNLQGKVDRWIARLENYISKNWKAGSDESSATQAARLIKEQLEKSIPIEGETDGRAYYRMLRAVSFLQKHAAYYLDLIEGSGDMDGALALLLVYVKNYCRLAQGFNGRLASLPELYRKQVLHARPCGAVQDNVYAVITPKENTPGFTLPQGQPFLAGQNAAGEDLIYQTTGAEYISPMYIDEVNAVFLKRRDGNVDKIYRQSIAPIGTLTADTLFVDRKDRKLALGWRLESSMLLLGEGIRKISIGFRITSRSAIGLPQGDLPAHSFSVLLSEEKGWVAQKFNCRIDTMDGNRWLRFEFTLDREGMVPTPCTEEIHRAVTEYPTVRIQTTNDSCPYSWASKVRFDTVQIRTKVSGIQNFSFYNELGEVDTTQPFYPFGPQAEKGAWFMFGNEEMGHKSLEEVRLKGSWRKLPETEADFYKRYKDYTVGTTIGTGSFLITTEWQENNCWHFCIGNKQHLFVPDSGEDRSLEHAELVFDFSEEKISGVGENSPEPYEYDRDRDDFFRATLQEPAIGFGTEAYRTLFTETMIHNSRLKEKKRKPLPSTPVVPMLADAELSYIACEEAVLTRMDSSSITLTRITSLSEDDTFPITKEEQPFIAPIPADNMVYFGFLHAKGEQVVRMYLDMALPKEKIPFYNPQPDKSVKLAWEYWQESAWKPLSVVSVIAEETCGLTQSGFIEIRLPEKITDSHQDRKGRAWLRASVTGDVTACLAVRGIRTNSIRLAAVNGEGMPLPAGTIQGTKEADERIESIVQPLNGFGGKPAETDEQTAVRQSSRISNRHRALTAKDYENLVLEHFPEVDKVQCITVPREKQVAEVCLVVFSRAEDNRYFLSPSWKLTHIKRLLEHYLSPFVTLHVMNPVYEPVEIHCKAVLWSKVQDEGKVLRQLTVLAQNYLAPWYRQGNLPELRQRFSYKELHARMVNHEGLMKLVTLEVDEKSLPDVRIDTEDMVIKGSHPWNVLLPKIKIELLSPNDGVNEAEIENNFIIG